MKLNDFEGNLYRQINQLVVQNYELIQSKKPITSKNSTGYGVWNVYKDGMFDMTKLITGSQGTLGVVTEIEFQLSKPKNYTAMLEIELKDLNNLDQIVLEVLKFTPESFECFDDQTLMYATKFIGDILKDFKKTPKWLAPFKLIPEMIASWTKKFPKLVLIAEFTAEEDSSPMEQVHLCQSALAHFNIALKTNESPYIKVNILDDIASTYRMQKEYPLAFLFFQKALAIHAAKQLLRLQGT